MRLNATLKLGVGCKLQPVAGIAIEFSLFLRKRSHLFLWFLLLTLEFRMCKMEYEANIIFYI